VQVLVVLAGVGHELSVSLSIVRGGSGDGLEFGAGTVLLVMLTTTTLARIFKNGRALGKARGLQRGAISNLGGSCLSKGILIFFNGLVVFGDVHFGTDRRSCCCDATCNETLSEHRFCFFYC